jgi:hypothetical protein
MVKQASSTSRLDGVAMFRKGGVIAAGGAIVTAVCVVVTNVAAPVATAAGSPVVVEGESFSVTPSNGGSTVRDSTASGGSALTMTVAATASKAVTVAAPATVAVRAKGQQCTGAPAMAVLVDGVKAATMSSIPTKWTDYPLPSKIAAGTHTIGIQFTNPFRFLLCYRALSVDTVTVVPDAVSTTTSTTTTSTSPSTTTTSPSTSTTSPTTTPPNSGTLAPRANLPGWTHTFADDFTRDAPVGSWDNGTDPDKIVYVGADGTQWRTYPSFYLDTRQKRPYRPAEVLSVSNGMLQFDLHNVQGQPAGANPSPLLANGSQYQTYGRYSARLRVDNPNLSEYHIAWLLWPESDANWPADGEVDWPDAKLDSVSEGFHHYARAQGGQDAVNTGVSFNDWHTYTIEWSPGRMKLLLDDKVVLDSTKYVPTKPMRWQLQTETDGDGTHRGNLLVDWVSVWKYAG